jgi:tetratricopeptide (TPR) repeat protein
MQKRIWLPAALLSTLLLFVLFTGCQDTYTTSAKVYMQQNNYDKAIEQCLLAVDQIPNNAEAYFVLGQAYGQKGIYHEMNEAFTKSLAISPIHEADIKYNRDKFYADLFNSGVANIKEDKLDDAARKFEIAIEILPKKLDGYKNLAFTYTKMGKDSMAVETYKKAIVIDSTDMELRTFMGILYYKAKKFESCISTMSTVMAKANPKSKQYADALYYTAYSYDLLGRADEALGVYEKALEQSPNDVDLLFNLGRLHYMKSNYEKALDYFGKVLQSNPDDFEGNMNVGNCYLQLKKYQEALPSLEKAVQIKPDNSQAWNNLAVAYINLSMKDKGKEAFDKAEALRKEDK